MWTNKQTLLYVINISVFVRSLDGWFNIPRPSACPQPRHSAQRWSNIPPLQATCATSWTAHEPCSPFLGGMERLPCWTGTWKSYDSSTSRIYIEPISKKYAKLIRLKTLNTLRNLRSVWLYIYISLWGQSGLPHAQCSPKIPFSSSWRPLHAAGGIVQGSHLGEGQSGPSTRPLQWCV